MNLVRRLILSQEDRAVVVTQLLLNKLNVRVTKESIKESLSAHPDYPSLLSISEILTEWNVDNVALRLKGERLLELEPPFILSTDQHGGEFSVVTEFYEENIIWKDDSGKRMTSNLSDFAKGWSGVVLLAEANKDSGEKNYAQKRRQEFVKMTKIPLLLFGFLSIIGVSLINWHTFSWQAMTLLISYIVGLLLSLLLLIPQFDNDNFFIKEICGFSLKTDCNNILTSPAAKIGSVSWAEIGFFYFTGGSIVILFSDGNYPSMVFGVLKFLNILALPYTFYSVYYQWKIAKTWCVLCLGVQGLLWFIFFLYLAPVSLSSRPTTDHFFLNLIIAFMIPILIWFSIKPFLTKSIKTDSLQASLHRIKNNVELFNTLLYSQKQMPPVDGYLTPIILGNSKGVNIITMITNPFCNPCAKAYAKLNKLLQQNPSLKANIIFSTCHDTDTHRMQIAMHLLALQESGKNVNDAMNNWYKEIIKDYESWSKKHPVPFIDKYSKEIVLHCNWCTSANIQVTPTFFINGYGLPEQYDISEIGRLISQISTLETY